MQQTNCTEGGLEGVSGRVSLLMGQDSLKLFPIETIGEQEGWLYSDPSSGQSGLHQGMQKGSKTKTLWIAYSYPQACNSF
jgi:hypothetical protein